MQRGVGQHQAELPVAGRDRWRDRASAAGSRGSKHDRPPWRWQQPRGSLVDLAELPCGRQVGDHHRERLVLAMLARAQRGRGGPVPGIDDQVVAAETLDGEHLAGPQQRGRGGDRVVARQLRPGAVDELQPRPAGRAADRLRVESPVGGVVILGRAARAHRESRSSS